MITSVQVGENTIPVSADFMAKVNNGETPYIRMQFVPLFGDPFWVEDGQFWGNGFTFTEATSSEGSFDVGGAVIGGFNFSLNNFDRTFDRVEFGGAAVIPFVYYTINGTRQYLPKGIFYINSHRTSGNIIQCTSLDGLKLMDRSQTTITYPITVQELIETLAEENGITLATETIHNGDFVISTKPNSDVVPTDRQMLSYACQITGNFARMNEQGELVIGWYDFDNAKEVRSTFNGKSLWTSPIAITGLKVGLGTATGTLMAVNIDGNGDLQYMRLSDIADTFYINDDGELIAMAVTKDGQTATYRIVDECLIREGEALPNVGENEDINVLYGSDEYVITIEGNPLITISNVATVCQMISERIFGLPFRPGLLPILSNPCLQAGDVLEITDNITKVPYLYPVTSLTYNKSITENLNCAMEDVEDTDLRLSSDYSMKVSVAQAMQKAIEADAIAQAAQEAAEVSGYQLVIVSDKGLALAEDGIVNLTAVIYDREMNEVDEEGTEFLYRWWVMQDASSATYLNGGKTIEVMVDDALCDYAAGIYFETILAEEGVNPFSLYGRNSGGVVLTDRAGLPLTARAAESVAT